MHITKMNVATLAAAIGLVLMIFTASPSSQAPGTIEGVRDQVMINTARLSSIERDIQHLESEFASHADRAGASTTDLYVLKGQVEEMRSGFKWIIVLVFGHVLGSSAMALKYYISRQVKESKNEHRQNDSTYD